MIFIGYKLTVSYGILHSMASRRINCMRVLWLVKFIYFLLFFYYLLRARERSNFGAPNKQEQQGKQALLADL